VELPNRIKGESEGTIVGKLYRLQWHPQRGQGEPKDSHSPPVILAPLFASLLPYASLRGLHALLDSPLPSIPCIALSHATGVYSRDKAPCGIPRVPPGDSPTIYPCDQGTRVHLTVTLPHDQRIEVSEAVVRWSREQAFAVEHIQVKRHTKSRLHHYVKRMVPERYCQELWIANV